MNKCWNCGIYINDPSDVCPLCKCSLEIGKDPAPAGTYPRAKIKHHRISNALAIYTACAIALEALFIFLHVKLQSESWFMPLLLAGMLAYTYITLRVSMEHSGYRARMLLQTLLGVMLVVLIDWLTGFMGWSVNYVVPGCFIALDLTILILMMANHRNWQSYIPLQILIVIISIAPLVLHHVLGMPLKPFLCELALFLSLLELVCTLIIGGKRARAELYRRFHF